MRSQADPARATLKFNPSCQVHDSSSQVYDSAWSQADKTLGDDAVSDQVASAAEAIAV